MCVSVPFFTPIFLDMSEHQNHLEALINPDGCIPTADFLSHWSGVGICILNKFPGDAVASRLGTILRESLLDVATAQEIARAH